MPFVRLVSVIKRHREFYTDFEVASKLGIAPIVVWFAEFGYDLKKLLSPEEAQAVVLKHQETYFQYPKKLDHYDHSNYF